mgnify:CR=1 FL=1
MTARIEPAQAGAREATGACADAGSGGGEVAAGDVAARDIAAARHVLQLEGQGLAALAAALDDSFSRALDLMAGVGRGRVVVSGMGKSGHVARKIAATLASTGTPAIFVHPSEASHGDLGMIARPDGGGRDGDVVICLSNSGETLELGDLVAYTRRFAIPLIAIVGRAPSALGQAADATLLLPPVTEACPMGLAPTTSTTTMLALGDALAVALLSRKGFTADQYQVLHPGGNLGRRLIRVSDIMHGGDSLPLVDATTPMSEALVEMTAKSFGCVGVRAPDGRLAGVITDGDLRRHMAPSLLQRTAGMVMTPQPKTIRPRALAAEALGQMNANNITSLFVAEDGRAVGIIHVHDCLRAGVA